MRLDAARKRAHHIAALQAGDDAALGKTPRHVLDALRDPGVVLLDQAELAHVVLAVRVKAGADEDHFRLELFQARHPGHLDDFAHVHAAGVGRHRHIEHVGSRVLVTAEGVERVLENAHHQHPVVAREDVFSAVAVVHVEIDHCHALQVVAFQRVLGGHAHVVEKAKPRDLVARRVVAGRAHGAKSVFQFAGHHRIGGGHGCTGRAQGGRVGVLVDGGVGVDLRVLGAAGGALFLEPLGKAAQHRDVRAVVCQLQVGQRRQRRLHAFERVKHARDQQPVFDGVEPLRAFGMPRAHVVLPAVAVGKIARLAHVVRLRCFLD